MSPIIARAIELFKSVSDLSKKVMDAGDPEKYAKGVEELHQGVSDTYDAMRTVIVSSDTFSDEEKLAKLAALAQQEAESKKKCGDAIQGNREGVAKIALDVFMGLLTCGISFAPAIIKSYKAALASGSNVSPIPSDMHIDDICPKPEINE